MSSSAGRIYEDHDVHLRACFVKWASGPSMLNSSDHSRFALELKKIKGLHGVVVLSEGSCGVPHNSEVLTFALMCPLLPPTITTHVSARTQIACVGQKRLTSQAPAPTNGSRRVFKPSRARKTAVCGHYRFTAYRRNMKQWRATCSDLTWALQ